MLVDVTFRAPKRVGDSKETETELRMFVPESLVMRGDDGTSVWVADQSTGTATRIAIETGAAGDNGTIEVTSGLTVASRLIVSGRDGIQAGDRIRVTGEEPVASSR